MGKYKTGEGNYRHPYSAAPSSAHLPSTLSSPLISLFYKNVSVVILVQPSSNPTRMQSSYLYFRRICACFLIFPISIHCRFTGMNPIFVSSLLGSSPVYWNERLNSPFPSLPCGR